MPWPATRRGAILAALALFLIVEGIALAGGGLLRARLDGTNVVLIGSGRSPSVLVHDGRARLLLAAGDDATAFGNGWRRWAGPLPVARVDVMLVAGGDGGAVAAAALDRLRPRWTATIGSVEPAALADRPAPLLPGSRRFRLSPVLAVTVERAPTETGGEADLDAWRLLVERDRTVVAVVPDGAAATRFAWPRPVAALIVLRGGVPDAVEAVRPWSLIVPQIVTGKTLRTEVATVLGERLWAHRLPPGEIARLGFADSGLRLPGDANLLAPVPRATPATRSTVRGTERLPRPRSRRAPAPPTGDRQNLRR